MSRTSVAVVIPAYDEAESLRLLLPELRSVLGELPDCDSRVHVVLRAAPMRRRWTRSGRSARSPFAAVLETRSAMPSARASTASRAEVDYVVIMDADGSHSPQTIPRLLEWAEGNDVVVASRYVQGGQSDNSAVLRGMSRMLNLGFRLVLGIPCRDVSTNFKLYHREPLQRITLTCDNFDIVEEILFRLHRGAGKGDFRVHEVPDYFHERVHGDSKRRLGPFVASYLVTLARLRLSSDGRPGQHPPA